MALLKSKKSSGGGDFTGYFEAGLVDIGDRSSEFEWADMFLEVTFKLKGSDYPQLHQIKGSFEKESDGTVKITSVVRHLNYLLDVMEFSGGLNTEGMWEDEEGNDIKSIEQALNHHIVNSNGSDNPLLDPPFQYLIYLYREEMRVRADGTKNVGKDGKPYKRVLPKIVLNTANGRQELESYVAYMKGKGYLKEWDGQVDSTSKTSNSEEETF